MIDEGKRIFVVVAISVALVGIGEALLASGADPDRVMKMFGVTWIGQFPMPTAFASPAAILGLWLMIKIFRRWGLDE